MRKSKPVFEQSPRLICMSSTVEIQLGPAGQMRVGKHLSLVAAEECTGAVFFAQTLFITEFSGERKLVLQAVVMSCLALTFLA